MRFANKHFRKIIAVLTMIAMTGCGAIINGTKQKINISSTPTGANVFVDRKLAGNTPFMASLERKNEHFIQIEMDGYNLYEVTLKRRYSGWVWGNILVGGLIGLAIDAGTGGMYKLSPADVQASMNKKEASLKKDGSIVIVTILKADPSWQKIGQLTRQVPHES